MEWIEGRATRASEPAALMFLERMASAASVASRSISVVLTPCKLRRALDRLAFSASMVSRSFSPLTKLWTLAA